MERSKRSFSAKSDRLSSLPDSLLCHILSFLPTKLSVATSILATRYRFLWADVINLDFDCYMHNEINFADTVSRVMLLRNVRDINTFRLILRNEMFSEAQLDTWIRTTIARNVQTLDINLSFEVWLPRCLFTCKTLVDLRLYDCGPIPDDAVLLPNLKKLHLDSFQYGTDEKLQNLISGCPVLEELNIQAIVANDLKSCIISSPTIKWLTLNLHWIDLYDYEDDFCDYKLEINAPAVRYLVVEDGISQHISTGTFNSLVEANICLNNGEVKDDVLYSSSVLELVEKVCQVKCLRLSIGSRQFLDSSFATATSKFINLTKLELDVDWLFLLKFLESADKLQVLIIREVASGLKCWREPHQVPMCLLSHLRQVTIDKFGYSEDEFKMVSYVLKNGEFLNMMDIHGNNYVSDLSEKKFNALQRISAFERRSQTCKLKFS